MTYMNQKSLGFLFHILECFYLIFRNFKSDLFMYFDRDKKCEMVHSLVLQESRDYLSKSLLTSKGPLTNSCAFASKSYFSFTDNARDNF